MKKQFLAAAVMVLLPLTASASDLGTGILEIKGTAPDVLVDHKTWSGDYDITPGSYTNTSPSAPSIKFATNEVFCISKDDLASPAEYTFYTSDFLLPKYTQPTLNFVTWVANWSTTTTSYTYNDKWGPHTVTDQDEIKVLGQKAIWEVLGVGNFDGAYNFLLGKYLAPETTDRAAYTGQWLVAMNGGLGTDSCNSFGQDFLVAASPVPVPSTLLLLGSGLTGLVAAGRRRKQR